MTSYEERSVNLAAELFSVDGTLIARIGGLVEAEVESHDAGAVWALLEADAFRSRLIPAADVQLWAHMFDPDTDDGMLLVAKIHPGEDGGLGRIEPWEPVTFYDWINLDAWVDHDTGEVHHGRSRAVSELLKLGELTASTDG